ncbi:histidine phosphatase family protein [Catenulispora subtropica]|uniref:Histidine phosphatase family protein n=1 Tax=Catenulispora subtropica TaxID=450798 RepID=A0ABP5DIX8_9ACTN
MPTRLILVRHGDSHHKADGVHGGPRTCRGLTDLGRSQAVALKDRLTAAGVLPGPGERSQEPAIYSSIIPRAIETAAVLAGGAEENVVQDCGLCTYHMADWADGMSWEQIRRDHRRTDGGLFHPFEDGNEAWADLVLRVSKALTSIAAATSGGTAVVVTHAEGVAASLVVFGSLPLFREFDVLVSPASITEWVTDDDPAAPWHPGTRVALPVRWTLARLNDAAHLT